jgi:hypothetical protein
MAGATVRWLGGTSTDVSVGANWVGGAVPAVGDFAKWDSVTTFGPGSGTFTNAVAKFEVTEGAGTATSRDLGTAASPLTLSAIATSARFANRGNVYVTSSGTVAAASFEMPNGGTAVISGGTWTDAVFTACVADIGASAVMTNIYSAGARGTVATNGTGVTLFEGSGTWTLASRDVATGNLEPGCTLAITGTSASGTAINISRGATFAHQSTGTVTKGNIKPGGIYTVRGNPGAAATVTLTTAVIWPGATLVESAEGLTLTVTTRTFRGPQAGTATGVF